jgi:hypothetical protein
MDIWSLGFVAYNTPLVSQRNQNRGVIYAGLSFLCLECLTFYSQLGPFLIEIIHSNPKKRSSVDEGLLKSLLRGISFHAGSQGLKWSRYHLAIIREDSLAKIPSGVKGESVLASKSQKQYPIRTSNFRLVWIVVVQERFVRGIISR